MYLSVAVVDSFPKVLAFALVAHVALQRWRRLCGIAEVISCVSFVVCLFRASAVEVLVPRACFELCRSRTYKSLVLHQYWAGTALLRVVVVAVSLKFSSLIRRFFVFVIVKRFIATQNILFERNKMP